MPGDFVLPDANLTNVRMYRNVGAVSDAHPPSVAAAPWPDL